MSQKVANYLEQHLSGEVTASRKVLDYFSTDGSVFELKPKLVVYPRNSTDVRKTLRFTWQLAEKGKVISSTARGKGTDHSGAAISDGIILVFPAHMNKLLELDKDIAKVEPGIVYNELQRVLHTHGRFLPSAPAGSEYSTIGGAISNNASGIKSVKYGPTGNYVKSLEVVLANGEIITTERLNRRDLSKKMGGTTFEAEIYRQLDALIMDNWELIHASQPEVTKNTAGYNLRDVKQKDGSFDLTPLIVGAQGTLGIVVEATLKTEPYQPQTSLIAANFETLEEMTQAASALRDLQPSAIEIVDDNLLKLVNKHHPNRLPDAISEPFPKVLMLIEFDDLSERARKNNVKKAKKILDHLASEYGVTDDLSEQEMFWKARESTTSLLWQLDRKEHALPIIEDGVVPLDRLSDLIQFANDLFKKYHLEIAIWGHAGDGNLHLQPFLDVSNTADRQKIFKLMDEYYKGIMDMGGTISGEHNDGRLRAPYLNQQLGDETYNLMLKVKDIFDPHKTLNAGVKVGVNQKELVPILRKDYSMSHLFDHAPRL